ncbi:sentrin-specific protease 1-like [Dysidea avara]|uniref:sentrin-specific protease 1-like n=1 Tax=Dysidea avara TaxID=196820 RepID=UPI00332ECDC4
MDISVTSRHTEVLFPSLMDRVLSGPGDEIICSDFHISVTRMDMQTLLGVNWLNDQIVNFYFKLIASLESSVYATASFFYTKLTVSGYEGVRRWTNQVDLFARQLVLIPVHLGNHWATVVIDFVANKIVYYDSKKPTQKSATPPCLYNMRDYLVREAHERQVHFLAKKFRLQVAKGIPLQHNGSDCGVFTCMYARYKVFGKQYDFNQEDIRG